MYCCMGNQLTKLHEYRSFCDPHYEYVGHQTRYVTKYSRLLVYVEGFVNSIATVLVFSCFLLYHITLA